ncbi:MAG: LPS assembly lipoprotein LptE [Planctomycetota bacterium]
MRRLWVGLLFGLFGCGYSSEMLVPAGRTIAVPIFRFAMPRDNEPDEMDYVFRHEVVFDLTRVVIDEILTRTEYNIAREDDADLILRGEVLEFEERVITKDELNRTLESQVRVLVRVRITRRRSDRVVKEFYVGDNAEFVVGRGETVDSATSESLSDLAEKLVDRMYRDF